MIKFPPNPMRTHRGASLSLTDSNGLCGYPIFKKNVKRRISEAKAWKLMSQMGYTIGARLACGRDLNRWYSYRRVIDWMLDYDWKGEPYAASDFITGEETVIHFKKKHHNHR